MQVIEGLYTISTGLFDSGAAFLDFDANPDNRIFTSITKSGLDAADVAVKHNQGNAGTSGRDITEIDEMDSKIITQPDGTEFVELSDFFGEFGAITVDNGSATVGTLKIKVKYGN